MGPSSRSVCEILKIDSEKIKQAKQNVAGSLSEYVSADTRFVLD
jgi:hypothetical protein